MTSENKDDPGREEDRKLDHPIETFRDLAELVHVLDRIAVATERQGERLTKYEALLRSLVVNNLLWSGALLLDAKFSARKSFQAPFATITVEDSHSLGPFLLVGGEGPDSNYEAPGVGRWLIPVGQRRNIPLMHTSFSITSLAVAPTVGLVYVAAWTVPDTSSGD